MRNDHDRLCQGREYTCTCGYDSERDAEIAKLRDVLDALWKECESAYCQALGHFSRTECLGWEAKVNTGVFGKAEYEAHKKANELIGRHHGIGHAVKTIRAALEGGAA